MHAPPEMFNTRGLVVFSEFKKYVRNMQFSPSLRQTMWEVYLADKQLQEKKAELVKAQQAITTLQALVVDTFVRERDQILDLEAKQKLEQGEREALDHVFTDMKKANCDECGLNGHLSCHCWISSQLNFDLMKTRGDLGQAYQAYRVAKACKEEREGLTTMEEAIRALKVEHEKEQCELRISSQANKRQKLG